MVARTNGIYHAVMEMNSQDILENMLYGEDIVAIKETKIFKQFDWFLALYRFVRSGNCKILTWLDIGFN